MSTHTKTALAAALILGAGSAALANDIGTDPSTAQSTREWQEYMNHPEKHTGDVGSSYGYFAAPSQQDDFQSSKKGRNR
jgi:hypothetical protein